MRLDAAGYKLEVDSRHAEHVIHDLGLEGASGGKLPGAKDGRVRIEGEQEETAEAVDARVENTTLNLPVGG